MAIHDLYASKASKGYGRFEADEVNYPSSAILRKTVIEKSTGFLEASKLLLSVLSAKAGSVPLATGGNVLMAQVTNAAHVTWFLVAIINNVDGSVINDETLEVVDAMQSISAICASRAASISLTGRRRTKTSDMSASSSSVAR